MGYRDLARLRDVVLAAADLTGPAQMAYLKTACQGDPELEREARRLLAADPDALGAVESGLAALASEVSAVADSPVAGPGDWLGPYLLERQLGAGGSGIVFEAVQESPVRRRVAVKILLRNRPLSADLARFRAEQQILAHLDHPNIAKVLDAGTTADGLPYFVLELVTGEPIDAYVRAADLSVAERVDLCLQACRAAEHAHGKGIIHRDLKPSNILVNPAADRPLVKVIDFGIARLLESEAGQTLTLDGLLLGTPAYMSPEQAAGAPGDSDVKTDVHALGNLLHEVLCGRGVYDVGSLSASRQLRIVAAGRRDLATRDARGRPLPADLRRIIAMATEPDRELRYRTAAALAEDLERFQERRPVVARGAGRWYLARKAAERHPYSAILLLLLTLVVFGSLFTLLNLNARERAAVRQAQAESARSASLANYLKGMMESADPRRSGPDVTMVEAFGEAATRAEVDLAQDPGTLAEVLKTIARVQFALDDNDAGLATLQRAEAALPRDPLHTEADLAAMPLARVPYLFAMGRNATADSIIAATLAAVHGRRDMALVEANALMAKGGQDFIRGAYIAGDSAATAARALLLSLPDPPHGTLPYTARLQAICSVNFGSRREAIDLLRQELATYEPLCEPDDPITIGLRGDLAYTLGPDGGEERVALQRQALESAVRLIGPDHLDTAKYQNNLAIYLTDMGQAEEAAPFAAKALSIWEERFGRRHALVALGLGTMGYVDLGRGDFDGADTYCRDALAVYEQLDQPGLDVCALQVDNTLATSLLLQGRLEAAEAVCRRGLGQVQGVYTRHLAAGQGHYILGSVLLAAGRRPEAEAEFAAADQINQSLDPPSASLAALIANGLDHIR